MTKLLFSVWLSKNKKLKNKKLLKRWPGPAGASEEAIITTAGRIGIITAVFNNNDDVKKVVAEIKSKKLGVSVVLSGLFTDVRGICSANKMKEHTYNISL